MPRRSWLIGVFAVLAFAQTLAYFVYLRDDPGNYNGAGASGDQVAYIDLAQQVLHGTWQGAVHYMPGYTRYEPTPRSHLMERRVEVQPGEVLTGVHFPTVWEQRQDVGREIAAWLAKYNPEK